MATWKAQTRVAVVPDQVLALLTEPDAIARWAPIAFELMDFEGERLLAGDRVRVQGSLAGRSLEFEVAVDQADAENLVLTATGPIRLEVEYRAVPRDYGSAVGRIARELEPALAA